MLGTHPAALADERTLADAFRAGDGLGPLLLGAPGQRSEVFWVIVGFHRAKGRFEGEVDWLHAHLIAFNDEGHLIMISHPKLFSYCGWEGDLTFGSNG